MTSGRPYSASEGETAERLLHAAAHLFAREGIDGVKIHEIHRLAGQRNESAVHYHFGNRRNLVMAILVEYDPARNLWSPDNEVAPMSAEDTLRFIADRLALGLATPEGRDWLRIVNQMMGRYPRLDDTSPLARGPAVTAERLRAALPDVPPDVVERRTTIALRFMTDRMAERAWILDEDGTADPVDEGEFLEELVGMSTAMLLAPVPVGAGQRHM